MAETRYVVAQTAAGRKEYVALPESGISYPPSGIAVSTGSAWGSSITPAAGYMYYNGSAFSWKNETYLSAITKAMVEAVLTGAITSHTHSYEPANANIQSHISSTSNPHSTTAAQVGLGNVTNESKATMFSSPTFTSNVSLPYGIWNSSGNIGIGTTSPSTKFDIIDSATSIAMKVLVGGAVLPFNIVGGVPVGTYWRENFIGSNISVDTVTGRPKIGYGGYRASSIGFNSDNAQGYIHFFTSESTTVGTALSERMIIDGAGNVGINTSSPSQKLHVSGNIIATGDIIAYSA